MFLRVWRDVSVNSVTFRVLEKAFDIRESFGNEIVNFGRGFDGKHSF